MPETLPDSSKDRILNELLYLQLTDNLKPVSELPEEWQPADYAELDDLDEVWSQYHDTVNMTASQLKQWSEGEYSKAASLGRSPITRNLELLSTPKDQWTGKHIRWARKTIGFVARMREAGQGEPVSKDIPYSKRDISLKNWAYDPKHTSDHAEVPDKYLKGTTHGSKGDRKQEIERRGKAGNPSYKPLPGDDAKTKSSGYTRRFEKKYGSKLEGDRSLSGIATVVAEDLGVSRSALLSALEQVKKRGMAAWGTGHRPGASQEQWWRARVYSFAVGGKTRKTADADLWKKVKDASADFEETLDFRAVIDRVVRWNGLNLGVEYLPGQVRFPGTKHSKKLRCGYGHIRGYRGNDKEALDCYIHPDVLDGVEGSEQRPMFAISQISPEDGDFDEYKVMIGWESEQAAEDAYLREMSSDHLGEIEECDRDWLAQFDKASFEESLDFARLKNAGNTQQTKNCTKGWPCGFTCLSRAKKNCKRKLEGQSSDLQQWLEKSAAAKPDQPQVTPPKPKLELKNVVTPADRAQYARQELELARQSGDRDRISKWEAEAKRTRQAALEAEQQRLKQTQTDLFGVDEYSNLPLFNFGEAQTKDIAAIFAEQAIEQAKPAIAQWTGTIQNLINEVASGAGSDREKFAELQERLPELYPQMAIAEFADVLGVAIGAAEGAGRYEVIEGLSSEEASFAETLDFARLKLAGNTQQTKNCTKGWPCGFTCLSRAKKNCKRKLEGQSANLQEWLEQKFQQALGGIEPGRFPKGEPGATQPSDPVDRFRAEAEQVTAYKPKLFAEHTISVDARINQAALEQALSQIQSEGAAERLKLLETIVNDQGIQAVFNDGDSKVKRKVDAMFGQLQNIQIYDSAVRRADYYKKLADASESSGRADQAARYRKKAENELTSMKRTVVAGKSRSSGFTIEATRHVVISTESKKRPATFEVTPEAIAETAKTVLSKIDADGFDKSWSISNSTQDENVSDLMTYLHEVGHQIHWAAGTPRSTQNEARVTRYSKTNDKEFFAEHFALWMLDAKRYAEFDPLGADFIEQSVRTASTAKRRLP